VATLAEVGAMVVADMGVAVVVA